jgi:hypothetical protein
MFVFKQQKPEEFISGISLSLFFPMKGTFFDDVDESCQKEGYKHQYGHKTIPSQTFEIHSIGIKENHLHVEQHKEDGYQEIFDGHGLTGIAKLLNTTFKNL